MGEIEKATKNFSRNGEGQAVKFKCSFQKEIVWGLLYILSFQ
jgi:hypothetical protein